MRVLVACEESGKVRDALRRLGHDAWSCDLLPSRGHNAFHYQTDVRELLFPHFKWDMLIGFPTCTYLCNSGVRWLYKGGRGHEQDPVRWRQLQEGVALFLDLWNAPVPRIALENPTMHRYAAEAIGAPTQSIQPWQFGHGETKRTCLWLKNLPPLVPTAIVDGRRPRVHHMAPGPDRARDRSETYDGIAEAMAQQWGEAMNNFYSGPSDGDLAWEDHDRDDRRDEAADREASDSLWVEVEERVNELLIECELEDTPQNRNELRDQAWQEVTEAIEEERYREIERRRAP